LRLKQDEESPAEPLDLATVRARADWDALVSRGQSAVHDSVRRQ
jgi:hypothetical protein